MNKLKKLKKEINELMKNNDFVGEKPFNYLGWFWRNLDVDDESEMFSFLDGIWWLDCAGKWDYPKKYINGDRLIKILEEYKSIIISNKKISAIFEEDELKEIIIDKLKKG